jgi:hypothetical protein
MSNRIIAAAIALMLSGTAFGQGTAMPGSSAPTPSSAGNGAGPAGSAAGAPNGLNGSPDMSTNGATGAAQPGSPSPARTTPGYIVPKRPLEPGTDGSGSAGKTNPD